LGGVISPLFIKKKLDTYSVLLLYLHIENGDFTI